MKIRLVGRELPHADGRTDGQTDMTKLSFFAILLVCLNKSRKTRHFVTTSHSTYPTVTNAGGLPPLKTLNRVPEISLDSVLDCLA